MKVTFLGTGTSQGVPVIGCSCEVCSSVDYRDKRLRSSVLIQDEGFNVLIDTGPDFRQQMLRERVQRLDAVLFTHAHKDHTAGLDDIRSFNFLQKMDMPVYGQAHTLSNLKEQFSYIFSDTTYPGIPKVQLNTIENEAFELLGKTIIPIEVMHYKLPVFGFRIGNFTYVTDANHINPDELEKIRGSKVFVLNSLHRREHISHYNLEQALEVIREVNPGVAYLTHIGHEMGLHAEVSKELPENVHIAYDGQKVEI